MQTPTFSIEEQRKFQKRLENGYDLTIDSRYNLWLSMHGGTDDTDGTDNLVKTCEIDEQNKCKMHMLLLAIQLTCCV